MACNSAVVVVLIAVVAIDLIQSYSFNETLWPGFCGCNILLFGPGMQQVWTELVCIVQVHEILIKDLSE